MKDRRKFSAEQKVAILRQHLLEKVPVSQVCEQHGIQPTQFYQWQKVFFEGGALVFELNGNGKDGKVKKLEQENARLKTKLSGKDEVIAEIMASHVQLKKILARLEEFLG